jgi:outer membrane lipoprotein-sorting protein
MKRALAIFLFALPLALSGSARAAVFSRADQADLDRVSAALSAIHTMQGHFVQIGPDGHIDEGVVYIKKPGEMRFEYAPPSPTLIVCDGLDIAVFNTQLHTVDRYPLSVTPLNILLSDHVDLSRNNAVTGVEHQAGSLIVDARSNDRRASGNISIVFSDPGLELKQWTIVDAQGLTTTVSLRNVQQGLDLSDSIFSLHGSKKPD